jgi:peptidoglycan DL-endopeptidase CwlO
MYRNRHALRGALGGVILAATVLLPVIAGGEPLASSTTPSTGSSPPTTVASTDPATSPAPPDPAALQTASGLLDKIRSSSSNLDQLESQYLLATQEAFRALQASQTAQSQLATTSSKVRRLTTTSSATVVGLYMSNKIQENSLSQFLSTQDAAGRQTANVYGALVSKNLAVELATLTQLRADQQNLASLASSEAKVATAAQARAQSALNAAQANEAQLLSVVSSQSEPVKAALNQLELQGNASEAQLLQAGDPTLRAGVANPPPVLPGAQVAILFALAQVGKPYLWGGSGPDAFDCSGLVQQAWKVAGVALPRVAIDQFNATIPISFQDLQPGDLVFFENPVGHVGIYVGNGQMIDAPFTGAQVRLDSIFWNNIAGFGRVKAS